MKLYHTEPGYIFDFSPTAHISTIGLSKWDREIFWKPLKFRAKFHVPPHTSLVTDVRTEYRWLGCL